jgi:hypothetical protein
MRGTCIKMVRVAVGHSVTFVDVVLNNGRLQDFSYVITKVNFCWWIMNLSAYASHVCSSKLLLSCHHLSWP